MITGNFSHDVCFSAKPKNHYRRKNHDICGIIPPVMTPEESLYLSIGQSLNDTVQSQLFGKPCFKTGSKAFICFFQEQMVFKLMGDIHKQAISLSGSRLFDPSGKERPMKEWVQVSYIHKDQWQEFAEAALKYAVENRKTMQ